MIRPFTALFNTLKIWPSGILRSIRSKTHLILWLSFFGFLAASPGTAQQSTRSYQQLSPSAAAWGTD